MKSNAKRMRHISSILALLQLVAIFEIAFGWLVLPGLLHSGDSAILDTIGDESLTLRIEEWHDGQVRCTYWWFVGFGTVQLILSSIAVVALSRESRRGESVIDM